MMKTSFTQYWRRKWIHYIPILFLCTTVNIISYAACDVSWSDVTMTINCEGDFNFTVDDKDFESVMFSGYVGGSQTSFWPVPVIHAVSTYASGSTFVLEVMCKDGSKDVLTGTLPSYSIMNGMGAGTYTFTGVDDSGIVDTFDPDTNNFGLTVQFLSKRNPTCSIVPNNMDGEIQVKIVGTNLGKCINSEFELEITGGTPAIAPFALIGKVDEVITFPNLYAGTYNVTATVDEHSCPCMLGDIGIAGPIILQIPTAGTTSLACNSQVNVSVSQTCVASIQASDMLRGVFDPCDPMLAMVDSIAVLGADGQPLFGPGSGAMSGSGSGAFGVTIPDVRDVNGRSILGEHLTVEVYSKDGNFCWGYVTLEDKSPPIVTCNDPGLMEILCLDYDGSVMSTIDDLVTDCSPFETTIIALSEINDCELLDSQIMRRIAVTYYAEDIFDNKSNKCIDTLDVIRFDTIPGNEILDVPGCIVMPPAFTLDPKLEVDTYYVQDNPIKWPADSLPLSCEGDYTRLDPSDPQNPSPAPIKISEGGSGFPRLIFTNEDGDPDTTYLLPLNYKNASPFYKNIIDDNLRNCNIGVDFVDLVFDFGCKIKIQRNWFLREWSCEGEQELPLGIQEIIITDFEAPVFDTHVPDMDLTVDAEQCFRFINIPKPDVSDNCDFDPLELELAIYDLGPEGSWNLIGPRIGANGQQLMSFDFPVGMNFIVYTVFDDCGNSRSDTTKVTVMDDTPPVVICKEFLIIGISGTGNVRLPVETIDNGTYDQCDLERVCVTRMDDIELLMSLDANNDGEVLFGEFDSALQARADTDDGCYRDYSTSSYERAGKFYISLETICTPYVDFCCADVNNQEEDGIMVETRAYDADGNVNRCMTFVELQDKNPAVITCMPDITVDCNFDLPSYDDSYDMIANDPLSEFFGSLVEQGNQKAFGIPDEFILSSSEIDYVDGTIFDNCSIPRISVDIVTDLDACGIGEITRRIYSHEDPDNRKLVCTQIIYIRGDAELEIDELFSGLRDTLLLGCMTPEEIINESFGSPDINSVQVKCSLLGISTENQLFLFNTQDETSDACFKIVRTFTVIDWCQPKVNGSPFVVGTFRQIIKVNDPDGPIISCAADRTGEDAVTTNDCEEQEVMLMATASDECTEGRDHTWTGRVELDRDGDGIFETFDSDINIITTETGNKTSKATHTGTYPLGTHRITWTISDRCGNVASCVQNFTIINTKKPTPFAIDISTVLMTTSGMMVEVWAADLENKENEGPCGETLMSSIVRVSDVGSRTDGGFGISQPALTFTCADVGDAGIDINYFVFFVVDGDSIFDFTTVNIKIQDNNDVCNSGTSSFITGNIRNERNANLPNVSVSLVGSGNVGASARESVSTNDRGDYAFPAMPIGGSYKIDPSTADDYLNGVSTLDLVMIQRYVLGLRALETPYRILAADINNDQKVTALDLVDLRSVLLGYKEAFTNNESWRFIDAEYVFDDPTFPFENNLREIYDIANLSSNMSIDFIGLKVGDVNGSVEAASILADNRSTYNLTAQDQSFEKGDNVSLELSASQVINFVGLQLSLAFDSDVLSFVGIDAEGLEINSEHIGTHSVKDGILSISWSDYVAQRLKAEEGLFTVRFRAKKRSRLSQIVSLANNVITAEIYNDNLETSSLGLVYNKAIQGLDFSLLQNIPNPFAETTQISFYLPESTNVTLTISDVTGRVIKNYTGSFDKGNNFITISRDELSVSGVMYYTLATDKYTDTKRMIVLK